MGEQQYFKQHNFKQQLRRFKCTTSCSTTSSAQKRTKGEHFKAARKQKKGTAKYLEEIAFLPMKQGGDTVLMRADGKRWVVVLPVAARGAEGLSFRQSKQLEDMLLGKVAKWGSLVEGTDTGDGWLQVITNRKKIKNDVGNRRKKEREKLDG